MFADKDEIRRVFKLLTGKEGCFDQDKIEIINCDTTADIKACPGSGKTTTLLAKLVLLAKRMPLKSGKGICVLTYTNVAIDEIKSKLGHKADVLFAYPNYFGTMQSFVDEFFARAALQYYYGARISLVDNERVENEMYDNYKAKEWSNLSKYLYSSVCNEVFYLPTSNLDTYGGKELLVKYGLIKKNKSRYILVGKMERICSLPSNEFSSLQISKLRDFRNEGNSKIPKALDIAIQKFVKSVKADFLNKRILHSGGSLVNFQNPTAQEFISIKEKLFKKGLINFYDSYNLALRLINEFPFLKEELAERFEYLFVDEMQDTGNVELQFLNNTFDKEKIKVQYFGDEDQAIYQSEIKEDGCIWIPQSPMEINMSKRFGEEIAKIINPFRLSSFSELHGNASITSLKPTMIVFDNSLDVLPKFTEILRTSKIMVDGEKHNLYAFAKNLQDKDPLHRYNVKAVGWIGNNEQPDRLSIKSYFPGYTKTKKPSKKEGNVTIHSFIYNKDNQSYQSIIKNLINGILDFLRYADVLNGNIYYTKQTLFDYLDIQHSSLLIKLKELIANSAKLILDGKKQTAIANINIFLSGDFCKAFNYNSNLVSNYCGSNIDGVLNVDSRNESTVNVYKDNGIEIKVDTVHSVKGETHVATLYMETFYHTGHESKHLWNQFLGEKYETTQSDSIKKEALKIAYVAMSRPRYLLCIAIHKSHFKDSEKIRKLWNVIEV